MFILVIKKILLTILVIINIKLLIRNNKEPNIYLKGWFLGEKIKSLNFHNKWKGNTPNNKMKNKWVIWWKKTKLSTRSWICDPNHNGIEILFCTSNLLKTNNHFYDLFGQLNFHQLHIFSLKKKIIINPTNMIWEMILYFVGWKTNETTQRKLFFLSCFIIVYWTLFKYSKKKPQYLQI